MAEIRVTARCFPTEDREKVVKAIRNMFPDFVPEGSDPVVGRASSTAEFSEILKRQRTRSAARAAMRRGAGGDRVTFFLNKQVAFAGKASFSEEAHPLGDLEVTILTGDPDHTIDELAPRPPAEPGAGR